MYITWFIALGVWSQCWYSTRPLPEITVDKKGLAQTINEKLGMLHEIYVYDWQIHRFILVPFPGKVYKYSWYFSPIFIAAVTSVRLFVRNVPENGQELEVILSLIFFPISEIIRLFESTSTYFSCHLWCNNMLFKQLCGYCIWEAAKLQVDSVKLVPRPLRTELTNLEDLYL